MSSQTYNKRNKFRSKHKQIEDYCDSDRGYGMWSVPYNDSFKKSGLLPNVLKTYHRRITHVKSNVFIVGVGGLGPDVRFSLSYSTVGVGGRGRGARLQTYSKLRASDVQQT